VLALPTTNPQRNRILQMLTSWKVRIEMIGTLDTEDEEWLMALSQAYLEWEQQTEQRGRDRLLALAVPALLEAGLTAEQIASRLETDLATIERILQQQQDHH
jgi:predicted transposase YdaD